MTRPGWVVVVAIVLLPAMVGCSDDEDTTSTSMSTSMSTSTSPTTTASPACTGSATPPPVERIDVTMDGVARTAFVHLPAAPTDGEPAPVVLAFHGAGSSAGVQQSFDGLIEKADEEGFVAVFPEGLVVDLNEQVADMTGWDVDGDEANEPAFVVAVLDELGRQVCIDPSRVYATGFSAGGHQALALPCALPDRIAAVAPVAGAHQSTDCASDRAVPTMAFHGLDDAIVPFEGRASAEAGTFLPVVDVVTAQAGRNGCTGGPEEAALTPTVTVLTWTGCEVPTILYRLDDHGHAWPGHPVPFPEDVLVGVFSGGGGQPPNPLMVALGMTPEAMAEDLLLTNVDVDATDLMWDFFTSVSG